MIRSNPTFRDLWQTLSDDERMEFGRNHLALSKSLYESGELIAAEGLSDPSEGMRVTLRDGQAVTMDGPYAEVKEHLVGFLLVECDDPMRAAQIAAQVPDAQYGEIEVRPVIDVKSIDL